MGFAEIFLIGVGLSMDAFAASVCRGLAMKKISPKITLITAGFFGGFQFLMPCIGYLLGIRFESYITAIDHWIAFGLLSFIGGKMIFDVIFKKEDDEENINLSEKMLPLLKDTLILAVATSIDALAVGITFAFLNVNIIPASIEIGCTTFTISLVGVFIGHKFGEKYRDRATVVGGIILIAIGIKILIEHLFG